LVRFSGFRSQIENSCQVFAETPVFSNDGACGTRNCFVNTGLLVHIFKSFINANENQNIHLFND